MNQNTVRFSAMKGVARIVLSVALLFTISCNMRTQSIGEVGAKIDTSITGGILATGKDSREDGILRLISAEYSYYRCTAALINNRWAITAAHCVYPQNKDDYDFTVASNVHQARVAGVYFHPLADRLRPEDFFNNPDLLDIALLRLESPMSVGFSSGFQFQDFRRKIYAASAASLLGRTTRIYSYGPMSDDPDSPRGTLHYADFQITYPRGTHYAMPALPSGTHLRTGDSGSPSFLGNELAGIVAGGFRGSTTGEAIASEFFRDWVMETVNTELESIPAQGAIIPTNRDLAGYTLASFSAPARTLPIDFKVVIRGPNDTISVAKATRVARKDIDSQWRDIYDVSVDSYPINVSLCDRPGMFYSCSFKIFVEKSDDPSRSVQLSNYAIVR